MEIINEQILNLALFFFIYSFLGWLFEFFYHFIYYKKLINSGFFYGPVLPAFGISSVFAILLWLWTGQNLLATLFLGVLFINILEYFVSAFSEKIFGVRFWNYFDFKFNLKGRISLESSIVWLILLYFLLQFIHPFILGNMQTWSYYFKEVLFLLFFLVIIVDFIFTVFALLGIRKILIEFDNNISHGRFQKNMKRLSRLLGAFPDLYLFIKKRTKKRFKDFDEMINRLK